MRYIGHLALPGPPLGGQAVRISLVSLARGDLVRNGAAFLVSLGVEAWVIWSDHGDS